MKTLFILISCYVILWSTCLTTANSDNSSLLSIEEDTDKYSKKYLPIESVDETSLPHDPFCDSECSSAINMLGTFIFASTDNGNIAYRDLLDKEWTQLKLNLEPTVTSDFEANEAKNLVGSSNLIVGDFEAMAVHDNKLFVLDTGKGTGVKILTIERNPSRLDHQSLFLMKGPYTLPVPAYIGFFDDNGILNNRPTNCEAMLVDQHNIYLFGQFSISGYHLVYIIPYTDQGTEIMFHNHRFSHQTLKFGESWVRVSDAAWMESNKLLLLFEHRSKDRKAGILECELILGGSMPSIQIKAVHRLKDDEQHPLVKPDGMMTLIKNQKHYIVISEDEINRWYAYEIKP